MLTLLLLHNTNALLARPSSLLFPFLTHFRCFFFVMDTVLASCNLQSCDISFSPKRCALCLLPRGGIKSLPSMYFLERFFDSTGLRLYGCEWEAFLNSIILHLLIL